MLVCFANLPISSNKREKTANNTHVSHLYRISTVLLLAVNVIPTTTICTQQYVSGGNVLQICRR